MNYKETIQWLFSQLPMYQRIGQAAYKSDLKTTIDLLNDLNNPQNNFKAIHIAGTNGKGSVSHIVASILQEAGYKIGLYTSPHLKDFRERIRVDGKMITEEYVTSFVANNIGIIEKLKPSFFEMTVAMAYDYFSQEKVDFAVLETGMGGRLDSTNICRPRITAITNIGYDHMQFLGETIEKIAIEKAGIIKSGIPIVIGRKQKETSTIFLEKAVSLNAEISYAEDEIYIKSVKTPDKNLRIFDIWHKDLLFIENAISPLIADYQTENLTTALQIILKLKDDNLPIAKQSIIDGLANVVENTSLKGRWQKLSDNPLTICDTGHNVDGIQAVIRQIRQTKHETLHIVFGMVNDKDPENILYLLPKNAHYYFCKPDIPRGMPEEELKDHAFKAGLNGETHASVRSAYNSALNNAAPDDLVFIGGSTFVVAEIV